MSLDARGWRIALVPDSLVNPPAAVHRDRVDVLGALEVSGYGILQLPPSGNHGLLLAVIADQVAEYAHHGYAIVAIGLAHEVEQGLHWRRLAPLLRRRNVVRPPRYIVAHGAEAASQRQRLAAFLASYELPVAEQERWRV